MGRTKGILVCKHCRRSNPQSHKRVFQGCKHCYTMFPEDDMRRNNDDNREENKY